MMSTCDDLNATLSRSPRGRAKVLVYVALCADSTHASGKCVSAEGIKALNEYFNQNIKVRARRSWSFPVKHAAAWIAARES